MIGIYKILPSIRSISKSSTLKIVFSLLIIATFLRYMAHWDGPYYPAVPKEIREPATATYLTKYGVSHLRPEKVKKILTWTTVFGRQGWAKDLNNVFTSCRNFYGTCYATNDKTQLHSSSAILFHADDFWITWFTSFSKNWKPVYRDPSQVWVMVTQEATPAMWGWFPPYWFNWTMTYRRDSTIVRTYGLYVRKTPEELRNSSWDTLSKINYFENKTKMAVIHVSNCADYSRRYKIIRELSRYIEVDEFGHCSGNVICDSTVSSEQCFQFFKPYKFYLAFENAICRDYITEKYLQAQVDKFQIPVVAASDVTLEILPPKSYLNVFDFPSIKSLADEMIRIGNNATLYNSFFEWRKYYKPPTDPMCDLCNALHDNRTAQSYHDMEAWIKHDTCSKLTVYWYLAFLCVSLSVIGFSSAYRYRNGGQNTNKQPRILILGAGFAGVAAAKRLKELGYTDFQIIEASDKVGGRVRHTTLGEYTVELGAQYIPKNTVVFSLMEKYKVSYFTTDFDNYIVRDINGKDITDETDEAYERFEEAVEQLIMNEMKAIEENRDDVSLRLALAKAGWAPTTVAEDAVELYDIELEYAFNAGQVSTKYSYILDQLRNDAEAAIVNDERGLSVVVENLLLEVIENDPEKLRLNEPVKKISQTVNGVTVTTNNDKYKADFVIVTFSSGALQSGSVEFEPELPPWKIDAIFNVENTIYTKVFAQFPSQFWDDTEVILYSGGAEEIVIFNMNKVNPGSNILSMSFVNENGLSLERMSDDQVKKEIVRKLGRAYGSTTEIPDPQNVVVSRWSQDPFFLGTWGNRPPGYTRDSFNALKAPVGRIYFAGEHTSFESYGYTFGAYESGVDVIDSIDTCVRQSFCQTYAPTCASSTCNSYSRLFDFKRVALFGDRLCKLPSYSTRRGETTCEWSLRFD